MRKTLGETFTEQVSRWAYAGLLRLLTPLYLARLWRRGAAEPLYRQELAQRLGFYASPAEASAWIWIHAVSLGETLAAAALIQALREQQPPSQLPTLRFLLTHSTATGRAAARPLLQAGDAQAWLPYDTPGAVRRFLQHWRPRLGVLMETEIWPTLQFEAARHGVPMLLANARLSARSQRRGERFAPLLHAAARRLSLVLAQTEADAQRLRASGAPTVRVCGNLKFDLTPDAALLAQGRQWRALLSTNAEPTGRRPVLLAAVTREGEEALLLQAWRQLPSAQRPLLLIVPRHPQRFDEVAALVRSAGLSLARRSAWAAQPDATALAADVWLGDSMREMALYYALADAALLGGSFAPLGGQNLIEAAACGCPLVMGPHTFNFADAADRALQAGAALRAGDMTQGLQAALALCADPARQQEMASAAAHFAAQHRGAAARMAAEIQPLCACL